MIYQKFTFYLETVWNFYEEEGECDIQVEGMVSVYWVFLLVNIINIVIILLDWQENRKLDTLVFGYSVCEWQQIFGLLFVLVRKTVKKEWKKSVWYIFICTYYDVIFSNIIQDIKVFYIFEGFVDSCKVKVKLDHFISSIIFKPRLYRNIKDFYRLNDESIDQNLQPPASKIIKDKKKLQKRVK